jgi:hypothetical protein
MNGPDTAPPIVMSGFGQGDPRCCRCIVGLNTELEVPTITLPATDTQYKFSPWSELNIDPEQLQIIVVMFACVPGIPV